MNTARSESVDVATGTVRDLIDSLINLRNWRIALYGGRESAMGTPVWDRVTAGMFTATKAVRRNLRRAMPELKEHGNGVGIGRLVQEYADTIETGGSSIDCTSRDARRFRPLEGELVLIESLASPVIAALAERRTEQMESAAANLVRAMSVAKSASDFDAAWTQNQAECDAAQSEFAKARAAHEAGLGSGPKPSPTTAIEPNPGYFSNPLLTEPELHPDLKPLFDAVVSVSVWSTAIARCYPDLLARKESHGMPTADEWPDSPAIERQREQHAEWVKAGEPVGGFLEPHWTELMREWSGYYRNWCAAIAKAKQAAKSPAVAAIMDAGEARPTYRWTTQTIIDLDNLASTLHPIQTGGVDGLGFIRCGLPPLPKDFRTHAEAVGKRIGELRSIPVSAVPPTPTVSVSPDVLEQMQRGAAAMEETRAGMARIAGVIESLGARDDGPKPPKEPKPSRRARRAKWLAEAMLTVRDHPEWPDATIAERAGIDKSQLSRSPEYQMAAQMARSPKTPDGSVTVADGDRSVEAVDDSFDPNRLASRQWQDEEDTDARIDREMKERNAKRNGRR